MKITKQYLRKLIKESLQSFMQEQPTAAPTDSDAPKYMVWYNGYKPDNKLVKTDEELIVLLNQKVKDIKINLITIEKLHPENP